MNIDLVKHNKIWLSVTMIIITASIAALVLWGLNLGIDFRGGTVLDYTIESEEDVSTELKSVLEENGHTVSKINTFEGDSYSIFLEPLNEDTRRNIESVIEDRFSNAKRQSVETIGPSVGQELKRQATLAVIIANIVVLIFLTLVFRKVPRPASGWEFGVAAIIAMLYDVLTVMGVFAVLGEFYGVEIDSLFVTAALTVMGFSLHDSIVVFDRIRENLRRHPEEEFKSTINVSLVETLARSMNLSASVLIVLLSLLVLSGESIRWFIFALFIGLLSGSYSSVFVASQVLVWWQDIKGKINLQRLPFRKSN